MIGTENRSIKLSISLSGKVKSYLELLKIRLSFLVAFSSGFGYALGNQGSIDWKIMLVFCLGGFLVSGGAIILNQIFEKDSDRMMIRTQNRPIPTGRVTVNEAFIFSFIIAFSGSLILMYFTNLLTVFLSLISLVLYAFLYTPLKRVGPVSVYIGAIPGALPPLIGWVAATGHLSLEAFMIFGIQLIWQFPHFWAIAWVADDDYKKAGFKLLPGDGIKDTRTAVLIALFTAVLVPLGFFPAILGITGWVSAVIASICGLLFLLLAVSHIKQLSKRSALAIMYGSFLYLPIVQIAYLLNKI